MTTLPQLSTPKHQTTLPISKVDVEYRPFLVKEEKLMIIADSSGELDDIDMAVSQVVSNCTFGLVDIDNLCQADLEWLLLQIRIRSKGSNSELSFKCENRIPTIDKNGTKHATDTKVCGCVNEIMVDVRNVEAINSHISNLIDLGAGIGMKMKVPSVAVLKALGKIDESEIDAGFSNIMACIESIFNADEVWLASELSREELVDYLESFNSEQFALVNDWVSQVPTLSITIDYCCRSCGMKDKITISGLNNFFD